MAVGSLDVGGSGSCGLKRDGELRGSSNDQLGLFILLQGYFCAGPRTMVTMVYIYILHHGQWMIARFTQFFSTKTSFWFGCVREFVFDLLSLLRGE